MTRTVLLSYYYHIACGVIGHPGLEATPSLNLQACDRVTLDTPFTVILSLAAANIRIKRDDGVGCEG